MGAPRAINVMYEQQLQHLPRSIKRKTLASIFKAFVSTLQPVKIAGILHDKDVNEQGEPVTPHVHLVLQFKNPRSLAQLAKLIQEPQGSAFQQWRGNIHNAYSYLVHQTTEAQEKYPYPVECVKANFDYPALLKKISQNVNKKDSRKDHVIIKELLDRLGTGELSKEEVIANLTGSQFAKAKRQIQDVHQQVQAENAKEWIAKRKVSGKPITVIWLYGQSETGKTVLAKRYAAATQKNYFISGSSKDGFQHYEGEHTVILDELRPKTFPYDDLLKMLDPYGETPKAPSRFFDKALMVDLFIITSPYNPKQFYDVVFRHHPSIDAFQQLQRRITFVQYMTPLYMEMQEYDSFLQDYVSVIGTQKDNILLANLKKNHGLNAITSYRKFNQFMTNGTTTNE
ncbi:hypothetical protein M2139_000457 [Enterococcus sp. PF1-24]|uniref:Rep family protein n=1 Tax=unclassified Enterococcus TaxID=2608891 RepID=UPI0024748514|nr:MULTISPECIES: Rep family protein [unclassified Enterococcus]MDH6363482.1 hypothetical protein [Enterococcus sp. PFB1-1]MDH6400576.1 hypothetical protein [Enterococcus sp. PF1-24]